MALTWSFNKITLAGIYIHIPFCAKRCHYCDFYTIVNLTQRADFVNSLLLEIEARKNFFPNTNTQIQTIYFGGGTPSLLTITDIERILSKIRNTFSIADTAEITIEVNPDDTSPAFYKSIVGLGINRLSIGIQSFDNAMLTLMNRRHNASKAKESVLDAVSAGITNNSIDLMYGLPGQDLQHWEKTLHEAFTLPFTHISSYHLIYEKGTVFNYWLEKGKVAEADEDLSWLQFKMLHDVTAAKGFDHYEIANLSLPGFHSRHNTSYWQNIPYAGLGPSASAFNGSSRFVNIAHLKKYMDALTLGNTCYEEEKLTETNKYNEYLMTGLRTKWGVHLNEISAQFGEKKHANLLQKLDRIKNNDLYTLHENVLQLTLKGWFISDSLISSFFEID